MEKFVCNFAWKRQKTHCAILLHYAIGIFRVIKTGMLIYWLSFCIWNTSRNIITMNIGATSVAHGLRVIDIESKVIWTILRKLRTLARRTYARNIAGREKLLIAIRYWKTNPKNGLAEKTTSCNFIQASERKKSNSWWDDYIWETFGLGTGILFLKKYPSYQTSNYRKSFHCALCIALRERSVL